MTKRITVFRVDEPEEVADCFAKVFQGLGLEVTKNIGDNGTEWEYNISSGPRLNFTSQYRIADEEDNS